MTRQTKAALESKLHAGAFGLLLAPVLLWSVTVAGGLVLSVPIEPARITPELSRAYSTILPGQLFRLIDDGAGAEFQSIRLTEDGTSLGPSRRLHDEIRQKGAGRYALNGDVLRFSSADNSDPQINGRSYLVVGTAGPGPWLHGIATVGVIGLIGLYRHWRKALADAGNWLTSAAAVSTVLAIALLQEYAGGAWLSATPGFLLSAGGLAVGLVLWVVLPRYRPDLFRVIADVDAVRIRFARASGSGTLFAGTTSLFIAAWIASLWWAGGINPNYSDTLPVSLWWAGEINAPAGTIQAEVYPHLQILLPGLIAALQRSFGLSIEASHAVLAALFGFGGLWAVGRIAVGVAQVRGWLAAFAGLLALVAFVQSWPTKLAVGYAIWLQFPAYLLGTWGLSGAILAWSFWLTAARGPMRVVAYALAGLLFNFHSTFGVIALGVFLAGDSLEALRTSGLRPAIRVVLIGLGMFALAATPQLASLIAHYRVHLNMGSLDSTGWWTLMAFRKPFHVYLWGPQGVVGPLLWLAVLWAGVLAALRQFVSAPIWWRLVGTGLGVAVFCVIAYVAFAVRPTPTLVGLVLTRAALLPMVALPALAAGLLALTLRRWLETGEAVSLVQFGSAASAIAVLSLTEADAHLRILVLALLLLICVGGTQPFARALRTLPHSVRVLGAVLAGAIMITPFFLVADKWRETLALMPRGNSPQWSALTDFVRGLDRNDMVLMPPYPYAAVSTRHTSPTDYGYVAFSVYATWLVPFEIQQIKALFGIDLRHHTSTSITQHLAAAGGILCIFERGYVDLTSNPDRIMSLRSMYPQLRYVVGIRPGVVADEWTCGPARSMPLPLHRVFENESYVVYRLP